MGNLGTITNACGGTFYDSGGPAGQYGNSQDFTATFCAPAGQFISFDFTSFNTSNAQDFLDIYDGADINAPLIGSFDGANSPGLVTSALGGCLTFVFSSNNSGTAAGWVANITCNVTPPGTGDDCIAALPFCNSNTYNFPNNTNAGNLGAIDCLFSTPNPVWYYMQITNPGTLNIDISQNTTAGVGIDVDFDLWGPFTSLPTGCASVAAGTAPSIDCSFSDLATEQANITNALAGQYYIILLTNFSNQAGTITFSTAAGSTASTNCNILCGITDVTAIPTACVPATNTYSVSGQVLVTNPPTSGNLVITSSCGGSVTIPGPFGNAINYTLNGLVPTGGSCNISASFTADATCNFTQTYQSPNSCAANVLNCPNYASVSTSPNTTCAGQVYYVQVANTACNGTISFQVQGNWGASGGAGANAQNASQISWNVTSNLTGLQVASGAGSTTVNGQNFAFNVGPLNPSVVGNLFTLNVFDSNGNGFGAGGNIGVYQNGTAVSTVINLFGASSFTQFSANQAISPATITINTPTGPVVSTVTNCKNFKVPVSLQNSNFCNTINISLPWTITCSTSGSVISSGVNNVTVYPSIPSTAEDIVSVVYNSLTCDWTVTPLNDCVASNIGSIFTITPNPLALDPPTCTAGTGSFDVVYNGVSGGPNCCSTGGPQTPVVLNQAFPQANFSAANSPFGGVNNAARLNIPPNNIGGIANSLTLTVNVNNYCFNPPGAGGSGSTAPYWVTIVVDGQTVYDQIVNPGLANTSVSINLANIPNGYTDNSVIQIYVYPNALASVTYSPTAICPTLDGIWRADISATINASFNDNSPTPAVCSFNSLPAFSCCPPVPVNNAQSTICSGASLSAVTSWQNTVAAANTSCVVYSSVLPVAGSVLPANTLTGVNSGNAPLVQTLSAFSYCDLDGSGTINIGDTYTLISTYTLTINPGVTVSAPSGNPTICTGIVLSPVITFTTSGASGIGPATQLPPGLTASWNANVISISGTPNVAGTYNYSIQVLGACGNAVAAGSITVTSAIIPTFNSVGPFCNGSVVPSLPTTSTNGITGGWSPSINNTTTTTYTFTPTAGQCATTAQLTIAINPNVTPNFSVVGPFCSGATILALPTTSINNITGTWTPAINNTTTTTYTFTPTAGQCATTAQLTITINPNVTPTFSAVGPYCNGASIPALPTTSSNNITGTWTPAINNTATTTYTFTPTAGQCATTAQLTITITPNVIPAFAAVGPFCSGSTIPALPTISTNNINGSWSPVINNSTTTSYTFTPSVGVCATTAQLTITINDIIDFSNLQFPAAGTICETGSFDAYGQIYNIGIVNTPGAGQAAGVLAQIGYSAANTNPSGWTNWSNANYNPGVIGNNDEYTGTISGLTPGTYYYAFRYQINSCGWQYGGYSASGGGAWGGANVSGVLNVIAAPNAGTDGTVSACGSGTTVNLFGALGGTPNTTGTWLGPSPLDNGFQGTYDPIQDNPGTYTYTVADPNNVCPPDNSTVSVTETSSPQASVAYASPVCANVTAIQTPVINGAQGGAFTATPGGLGLTSTGTFNPTTATAGTYTVTYTIAAANGCSSFQAQTTVVVQAAPAPPALSPANPCATTDSVFTASGGNWYEFLVNGVSTGLPSANSVLDTTALAAGTQVCVRSYQQPPFMDGNLTDPAWTPVIPGTTGGPASQAPFSIADTRLDGLKMLNRNGLLYFAVAGNEIDGTLLVENNRILLFIDSRAGGFNSLSAWVNRSNAGPPPFTFGIRNLDGGIQFDPGFEADYILSINRANLVGSTTFYDLYDMVSNTNVFLGSSPSAQFGYQESFVDNDLTRGFEFYIPLTLIGSPVSLKVFGMLINDPGEFGATLVSNQFFSVAGGGDGNYGNGSIFFGQAAPNPVAYVVSQDCFEQRCVTLTQQVTPLFAAPAPICAGGSAPELPTSSSNVPPITGTWSGPVSNQSSGTYTFTPTAGQCAAGATVPVTVNAVPVTVGIFHD